MWLLSLSMLMLMLLEGLRGRGGWSVLMGRNKFVVVESRKEGSNIKMW